MAQDTSAADVLQALFASYGLASLGPQILAMAQANMTQDEISIKLQQTPEWQARFAGNVGRKDQLSPAEYINREQTIAAQLHQYGLPSGFYDTPDDFAAFIKGDVGGQELDDRLKAAQAVVTDGALTGALAFAQQNYGLGTGDLMAYFLDPNKAGPLLTRQAQAAQIGADAATTGYGSISAQRAEQLAAMGVSDTQARQGFSQAQQLQGLTTQVGDTSTVSKDEIEKAIFEQDANATTKVARAQSERTAAFQGGGTFATTNKGVSGLGSANT